MEMNGKVIQYILEQNNEKEHGSQHIKFIEDTKIHQYAVFIPITFCSR